jgi:isopenicillin N synthase-like dioxygenase
MNYFYDQCHHMSREILTALALGLGLPSPSALLASHSGLNNQLRLLHYPPLPAALLENEKMVRIPGHSDWSSITMLFQDDCGGLEVEHPREPGRFLPVPPITNALVLNIGDLMMRWSNDVLRSTVHRVGLPPGDDRYTGVERMVRERYSIPYFVAPDPDTLVECLESCVGPGGRKYDGITQREYGRMRAMAHYMEKPAGEEGV